MNIIDTDGNGTLEIDEFFAFMAEKEKTEEDEEMLRKFSASSDNSDIANIQPLVAFVKEE